MDFGESYQALFNQTLKLTTGSSLLYRYFLLLTNKGGEMISVPLMPVAA